MARSRNGVTGEQLAQVDNRDPFAAPVWRSPVYRTPEPLIFVVQLIRLVWRVLWFALTHPLLDAMAGLVVITWLGLGTESPAKTARFGSFSRPRLASQYPVGRGRGQSGWALHRLGA